MKRLTELALLITDPDRRDNVPREAIPALIGEAEELRARLWARLQSPPAPTPAPIVARNGGPDRLLTVKEAAERLSVNARWLYRHADTLPFTRRLTEGTLRFSERGLDRWQESRAA